MRIAAQSILIRIAKVASLAALALSCATAGAEQWVRAVSGPDVYVRSVRVFPNQPVAGQSVLFAATLGAGVLRVVDNGAALTVTPINNGLPLLRIRTVASTDALNLVAAVEGYGVYKSTDGGANWTAANGSGTSSVACRNVRNLAMRSTTEYWAFGACRRDSGIYRTLDGGATWARLGLATIPDDASIGALTFFGTGTGTAVVASTATYGMYRSNDNGATWAQINNGIPSPGSNRISVFNAVFLSTAAQMMAYVEGQGVFRSSDSGATWTASGTGIPAGTSSLSGLARESSTVFYYPSDKGPIYRTTDAGLTWAPWGTSGATPESSFARGVTLDATAAGRFWVHGLAGLSRTNDNGATFAYVPLPEGYINGAVIGNSGVEAYLSTNNIFKIADFYNPNWNGTLISAPLTGGVGNLLVDRLNTGTLYAAVPNRGLYKTTNDGTSWSLLPLIFDKGSNPVLEHAVGNSQLLYAGLDNKYDTATGGGFFKSPDGGTTWTDSSVGLSTPAARQVNSFTHSGTLLIIAANDGLYRSTDGAATWTLAHSVMDGLGAPLPFSTVRMSNANNNLVWAAANHVDPDGTVRASSGVYKSINGGATWTQVLAGKRAFSIRAESSGRVIAMFQRDPTQPAMLATTDGGATWVPFINGLLSNDGVAIVNNSLSLGNHVSIAATAAGTWILQKPMLTINFGGTGSGSVTTNPSSAACSATCNRAFFDSDPVTLTATATGASTFAGWTGCDSSSGATCTINSLTASRSVGVAFAPPGVATDLNQDGRSDLLYRNVVTGQIYRIFMNGFAIVGQGMAYTEPDTAWKVVADADFNGDGVTDLLWKNDTTGQVYLMPFSASGVPMAGAVVHVEANPAWKIIHTPDLNSDGKADILWWNSSTGQLYGMVMNGASVVSASLFYTEANTAWKIVATGDFAGSGRKNQLLWRNSTTGQVYLMTVSVAGATFSQTGSMIYTEPNTAWKIIGAADFNGDGKSDLLWRNSSTGQVYVMLMNGGVIASQGVVYTEPSAAWQIVATGDYDGNGKADLLWRNETTGQVYMVLMNGLSIASQAMVYAEPNTAWKLLGPREYGLATGIMAP